MLDKNADSRRFRLRLPKMRTVVLVGIVILATIVAVNYLSPGTTVPNSAATKKKVATASFEFFVVSDPHVAPGTRAVYDSAAEFVEKNLKRDDFVVFLGDMYKEFADVEDFTGEYKKDLQKLKGSHSVYAVLGNNDLPSELYLKNSTGIQEEDPTVRAVANVWRELNGNVPQSATKWGFYSVLVKGVRLIFLNTQMFWDGNINLEKRVYVGHPDRDISKQQAWLENELKDCRARGQTAIIFGHVPPSYGVWRYHWQPWCYIDFHRIIKEQAEALGGMIFGHLHHDHYSLFRYDGVDKAFLLQQPSIAARFKGKGVFPEEEWEGYPTIRKYMVNNKQGIIDYIQYRAKTTDSGVSWVQDYRFSDKYGAPVATETFTEISKDLRLNDRFFKEYYLRWFPRDTNNMPLPDKARDHIVCATECVHPQDYYSCYVEYEYDTEQLKKKK